MNRIGNRSHSITGHMDWLLIGMYLVLVIMGWMNIYAATYDEAHSSIFDMSQNYGKQAIWIGLSLIMGWAILMMDGRFFESFAFGIYGLTILLLIAVLVLGTEIKGNKSWIILIPGKLSLQPSEFAKFGTSLAVAKLLSSYNTKIRDWNTRFKAMAIIGLPALLIMLQPDTGSALVYISFVFVLYREGLSGNILLLGLAAIVLFVLALLVDQIDLVIVMAGIAAVLYAVLFNHLKFLLYSGPLVIATAVLSTYVDLPTYSLAATFIGLGFLVIVLNWLKKEMKSRSEKNVFLFIMMLCLSFVMSVDFVFNHVLKEHQRTRITVLLGEESKLEEQITVLQQELETVDSESEEYRALRQDIREKRVNLDKLRKGAGWNVNQSKIAIGSGGFAGKGFLEGTQTKYNFVPEQSTDFIFCTVGEEWGFMGSFLVISMFLAMLFRIVFVAERQKNKFSRIYAYCVASILFIHFMINIAMTIGLAPVIGIPLPFFSYGGSSLWGFSILLFILIRLDAERKTVLS